MNKLTFLFTFESKQPRRESFFQFRLPIVSGDI